MTSRDRIVLLVLGLAIVLGGVYLKVVSPERKKAAALVSQVSAASTQLASTESELASARSAQSQYAAAYASLVELGKAVPPQDEVPALIFQLQNASEGKSVTFSSISSGSSTGGSSAPSSSSKSASPSSSSSSTSASASSSSASAGSASSGSFTALPFTFGFEGGFHQLASMLETVEGFTKAGASGKLQITGRLLSIERAAPQRELGWQGALLLDADRIDQRERLRAARLTERRRHANFNPERHARLGEQLELKLPDHARSGEGDPMKPFLNAIKEDLLDRNRLPYLIGLSVALVAALAFTALGGGSKGSTSAAGVSAETSGGGAVAVSAAPTAADAAAETFSGASQAGPGRDFFAPLPGSEQAAANAAPASPSSTATAASTSSSSGSSSSTPTPSSSPTQTGGSTPSKPSEPSKPKTPSKPKQPEKTYNVTLLFGVASPPPAISQLTPYDNVTRGLQLPSQQVPLVTFSGWTTGGASATFTLSGEAILHGPAVCVPSPTQCTAIQLKPGEAEQLEYVPVSGPTVNYELQVVTITPSPTK